MLSPDERRSILDERRRERWCRPAVDDGMKTGSMLASLMLMLACQGPALADTPAATSSTVFGTANEQLVAGAEALRNRLYRKGVELTLSGLEQINLPRDIAAALSNLCAGYVGLKEFALALKSCDESLELDPRNWRTWNNRAAAHLGQGQHDAAIMDVQEGLQLAPQSATLQRTLAIVEAHKRAREYHDSKAIKA
jgi:tetratricopeptide (TPR) repeat protein